MNYKQFNDIIINLKRPLILDGAMGSLIQQNGLTIDKNIWTTKYNFTNPELIINIHKSYIESGCDIISTNTFRTNPNALKFSQYSNSDAVKKTIELAKRAVKEYDFQNDKREIIIAGVNPPAEDCYQKDVTISKYAIEENHKKHISMLYEFGADIILNETQSHFDEIKFICKFCSQNELPFIISIFVTEPFNILSGESLRDTLTMIKEYSPNLISFNCISPNVFYKILSEIELSFDWGFYLNCGSGNFTDSNISCGISPIEYSVILKNSLKFNPKLIGACCGSNPNHISIIKKLLYD